MNWMMTLKVICVFWAYKKQKMCVYPHFGRTGRLRNKKFSRFCSPLFNKMSGMSGDLGDVQDVTPEIQTMCDEVRWMFHIIQLNSTEFQFWVSNCTGLGYSLRTPIILRQQSTDIVSECFAGHYNYIIICFYFSVPEQSVKLGTKQLQFLLFKDKLATSWDGFNVAEFSVKPRFQTDVIWI